jgi:predicted GNAT family acetyltransferase
MIRILTENDRRQAMDFLLQEPSYNVFAIGDVENFGFDANFQDVWADVGPGGEISTVILRYFTNYFVYSPGRIDAAEVGAFLRRIQGKWILSGKEEIVESLASGMRVEEIQRQLLAELTSMEFLPDDPPEISLHWATKENFEEVLALQREIEEFDLYGGPGEAIAFNMKSGTGRTACVSVDDRIVASASSAAENSRSAMVIGVCTASEFRNRGLATACVSKLCRSLVYENKTVCLFYNNPSAARIYRKIGFRDAGRWAMATMGGA